MIQKNKENKRGLGKGLGALVNMTEVGKNERQAVRLLPLEQIIPTPDQPRQRFDDEKLHELAASIKQHGVIQPLIVRKSLVGQGYEIVAGERRWRASRLAGLTEIPVLVRELTDSEVLQQALIENIQRADLNPIEEAEAFMRLLKNHDMTQEDLAKSIGRSRPAIANAVRLLELPPFTKMAVVDGRLSSGHAKVLLGLEAKQIDQVTETIVKQQLSVRDTEKIIVKIKSAPKAKKSAKTDAHLLALKDIETKIMRKTGCRVKIQGSATKGKLVLHYSTSAELEKLFTDLTN